MKKNAVSSENKIKSLCHSKGIATMFETLRKIQFSIFRRAKSHIPAQATDDTKASKIGTSELVKLTSA